MENKPFSLHVINPDPDLEPLKVVLPDDGHCGFVIGEDWEVKALYKILGDYLNSGVHDGEIPDYHEQLGSQWLSTIEAQDMAAQQGNCIPIRTIRWAASHGFIRGAEKQGRDWRFPQRTFLHWMKNRPKPGRKKQSIS